MSEHAETWRWKAIGTLRYDDGDKVVLSLDRFADGPPIELVTDLLALLDTQTTWELCCCVIEVRAYEDETTCPPLWRKRPSWLNSSRARAPGIPQKEIDDRSDHFS